MFLERQREQIDKAIQSLDPTFKEPEEDSSRFKEGQIVSVGSVKMKVRKVTNKDVVLRPLAGKLALKESL